MISLFSFCLYHSLSLCFLCVCVYAYVYCRMYVLLFVYAYTCVYMLCVLTMKLTYFLKFLMVPPIISFKCIKYYSTHTMEFKKLNVYVSLVVFIYINLIDRTLAWELGYSSGGPHLLLNSIFLFCLNLGVLTSSRKMAQN